MHVVYPVDAAVHIHQVFHAASVAAALPQRLASSKIVGRRHAVHRLRCPDAAVVILVGRARPRLAQGRQLPAVLPSEGQPVTVRQRVPYRVIGDALPIVRCQLILPVRVRIPIGDGGIPRWSSTGCSLRRRTHRSSSRLHGSRFSVGSARRRYSSPAIPRPS